MTTDTPSSSRALAGTELGDALSACARGSLAGLEALAIHSVPSMVTIGRQFMASDRDIEDVVHDTLVLAWHNVWRFDASQTTPGHWLMSVFGSRLGSQLRAPHIEPGALPPSGRLLDVDHVNLPPPQLPLEPLSGERLWDMARQLPGAEIDDELKSRLYCAFELLSATAAMPLTPDGEHADPSLFDPILAPRMQLSRFAFRAKEAFNRHLGMRLETAALALWRHQAPGSRRIEATGLPRRAIENRYADALDVNVDPRALLRQVNYPRSFPDRRLRHRIGGRLLWHGNWDLPLTHALASRRMHFIADIWEHRRDPAHSASFHQLAERLARGKPVASHSEGMLLDRPERILAYLKRYLLYMESMACFGFDEGLGKDRLGAAVDRHGGLIKINKGLHRMAMAQVLGVPSVRVRVRGIHRQWWLQTADGTQGEQALERVLTALPSCRPSPPPA